MLAGTRAAGAVTFVLPCLSASKPFLPHTLKHASPPHQPQYVAHPVAPPMRPDARATTHTRARPPPPAITAYPPCMCYVSRAVYVTPVCTVGLDPTGVMFNVVSIHVEPEYMFASVCIVLFVSVIFHYLGLQDVLYPGSRSHSLRPQQKNKCLCLSW